MALANESACADTPAGHIEVSSNRRGGARSTAREATPGSLGSPLCVAVTNGGATIEAIEVQTADSQTADSRSRRFSIVNRRVPTQLMSTSTGGVRETLSHRRALSTSTSFRAAAAIAFLVFAANAAVSPLYRIYQAEFGFSATTLTLLFAVYIAVLLLTLLFLGSVSDYAGRRPVMLAGLIVGAAACGLFLSAHALELLFAARALQGLCARPAARKAGPARPH